MDLIGIEPMTSSMPWKRAPSCATGPHFGWETTFLFSPLQIDSSNPSHASCHPWTGQCSPSFHSGCVNCRPRKVASPVRALRQEEASNMNAAVVNTLGQASIYQDFPGPIAESGEAILDGKFGRRGQLSDIVGIGKPGTHPKRERGLFSRFKRQARTNSCVTGNTSVCLRCLIL